MIDIQEILPSELNSIKKASDNCVSLAQKVEEKFGDLMDLIGKLLEISQHATGSQQKRIVEAGFDFIKINIFFHLLNEYCSIIQQFSASHPAIPILQAFVK